MAGAQGSGVLLTPTLVLTSAHVLDTGSGEGGAEGRGPHALALGGHLSEPVPCEVVWKGETGARDAALLLAERPLVHAARLGPLRWGVCVTWKPMTGCQAMGFPQVQRSPDGSLEAVQVPGTLTPLSGSLRRRYVLRTDHHPPAGGSGGSPWAGLSGGPVLAGQVLIGIVSEDPPGWDHSAVDAVPLIQIVSSADFWSALRKHWPEAPSLLVEEVFSAHPEDLAYEAAYAKAVKAAYSRLEIFGLDDLGSGDDTWDLDTAYLSLEARAPGQAPGPARAGARRVEDLLGSRPRTVLRGEAGAGKTTLVWWLASHAACHTLPRKLGALNGLVPFVVPLRSLAAQGITAPTPSQLPTIARLPVDAPPPGWAGRVLESGRALLLVDGLDELPREDRAPARRWLAELLRLHPATRCLVTVRPLAVDHAWLEAEGFEELRLLPMSDTDIQSFVAAWHTAARLECAGYADGERARRQRELLVELEGNLTQEFRRTAGLRDLARTPLLCAVVCALHRRRSGLLPRTRWELYRAALTMLLGGRDAHRRIHRPEGMELEPDDGRQLLQRVAVWLVRNGRVELSREQAVRQIALAMRGLRRVRDQGTPEEVLTHLLNRSGLLQERTRDSVQFIHRTFQDYLAAKEFQDSDCLDELLSHAAEEPWQDVIRLVIGHCGRAEERRVLEGVADAADAAAGVGAGEDEWALRALSGNCAADAAYLDDDLHDRVWGGIKETAVRLASPEAARHPSGNLKEALTNMPCPGDFSAREKELLMTLISLRANGSPLSLS
ncbi:NACHT domain-containing protein [Streptomyces albireticuli]|uniref:NACHT domain-containing protein n=1 Tax=Streptomyces albireticuli TaxID=1940 RepID=UPI0036B8135F